MITQETRNTITIDGIRYNIKIIDINRMSNKQAWVTCQLNEGKNLEICRIFAWFGLIVSKLIRVQYGPYNLNDMKKGEVRQVANLFYPNNNQSTC